MKDGQWGDAIVRLTFERAQRRKERMERFCRVVGSLLFLLLMSGVIWWFQATPPFSGVLHG